MNGEPSRTAAPRDGLADEESGVCESREDRATVGRVKRRLIRRPLILGGLALAAVLALVARSVRPKPALAVLGQVPAVVQLVDEHGAPFDSNSMRGHVTVVDFIFTRCASSCPRLSAAMEQLQDQLASHGSRAKLVSFSVDPENDTPAVLSEYAVRVHADPSRWSFLTGRPEEIMRVVVAGFKVAAVRRTVGAADYDVIHGDWFVLVDRRLQIRGYYSIDGAGAIPALLDDVLRLENE